MAGLKLCTFPRLAPPVCIRSPCYLRRRLARRSSLRYSMTTVRDLSATSVVVLLLLITTQGTNGFVCNQYGNFCIDDTHYGLCVEQENGDMVPEDTTMYRCLPEGTVCVSTSELPCEVPPVPTTPASTPPAEFTCSVVGYFPYPEDCTKYNKCYRLLFKLRHKVAKCLLGFGFSTEKSKCVIKSKSDCAVAGAEGEILESQALLESQEDDDSNEEST